MIRCGSYVKKYVHRIKEKPEGYVDTEAEQQHLG